MFECWCSSVGVRVLVFECWCSSGYFGVSNEKYSDMRSESGVFNESVVGEVRDVAGKKKSLKHSQ